MKRLLVSLVTLAIVCGATDTMPLAAEEVVGAGADNLPADIGYTRLQTNLPGGRHANIRTMRAMLAPRDGGQAREIGADLASEPEAWTQFGGWSFDGSKAMVSRGWESPDNAAWEEEHSTFRFTPDGWLLDTFLIDPSGADSARGKGALNLTAVERVSFYNGGAFPWPGEPGKLGFTALIDGNSHPFRMDADGRHKVDLTANSKEFAYGFESSRDGKRICYHKSYKIFLADADGSNAKEVPTGQPFNFGPQWSPGGEWVLFVAGEHYNCHPYITRADGSETKKLADRAGYRGVIEFLDVRDFHGGSSDTPIWSADGRHVYYTAMVGPTPGGSARAGSAPVKSTVELFRVSLDGQSERLTHSAEGTLHYHPRLSPDGQWLAYGSKRAGARGLYARRLADGAERQVAAPIVGQAAMWPLWRPAAREDKP